MAEGLGRATVVVSTTGLDDLYRRHAPEARRLAYLLTGDHAAAEDIAHDAFVKLAGRLFALRSPEATRAYLRKTVVNTVVSKARSRQREEARVDAYTRDDSRFAAEYGGAGGYAGAAGAGGYDGYGAAGGAGGADGPVWAALLRLPPRQRAAIVLRHWLDLSEARTAQLMGCGVGTVKSLVSRGLATLREAKLEEHGEHG